jgi:glycosyltransferase involved in cell wall biosynthesis
LKVVVLPVPSGWGFFRSHQPYDYIENVLGKGIFYIHDPDVHDRKRLADEINQADIVIIHRPNPNRHLRLIRAIMGGKEKNQKVVVDCDDDDFNVSPWNPAYQYFGTKEISVLYSDKTQVANLFSVISEDDRRLLQINPDGSANVTMWKDKEKGFDIEANLKKLKETQSIINEADLLTVPTPQLADKFRLYRPDGKIVVLPNLIDFNIFLPMNKKNDGKLRIVWHGGVSHYRDLVMVKLELISFAKKHPEVEFAFQGVNYPGLFHEIGDRVTWLPWHSDMNTYPLSLSELAGDIAICPLTDDTFNYGKSPLKWEEMSAMKVPCVCSPIVYDDYIEHGKTGFIAREGEWGTYLEKLLDPALREQIGQNAYDAVKRDFSLKKATLYWAALEELFKG